MDAAAVADANLMSVDGTIRVLSDQFSVTLLNPELEAYRTKADKYTSLVRPLLLLLSFHETQWDTCCTVEHCKIFSEFMLKLPFLKVLPKSCEITALKVRKSGKALFIESLSIKVGHLMHCGTVKEIW